MNQATQLQRLHQSIIARLEAGGDRRPELTRGALLGLVQEEVEKDISRFGSGGANSGALTEALLNRMLGLGPIEPLLHDPEISEIMVNGLHSVFVERNGRLIRLDVGFESESEIRHVINRIVGAVGRRIDESSPLVDARLPDGSRVHAVIPPLSRVGPVLTIRRFPLEAFSLEKLLALETMSRAMAEFLKAAVLARQNILISGSTGSGKTSTLNALGAVIPPTERLITIEDTAEMRLEHPHLVRLEARPPNIEGQGEITIRTLLKNALRMRPDRIVIGEIRGGEALDMLQAMNTGHQGSLTTIHANSPEEALLRLETMALMADVDLPLPAIREQVKNAIHFVVQQERLPDGRRKVVAMSEMLHSRGHSGQTSYDLQPLFSYHKLRQRFEVARTLPERLEIFENAGITISPDWFIDEV